jgi:hypothetical protein
MPSDDRGPRTPDAHASIDEVITAESARILRQRKVRGYEEQGARRLGLAFSGGGIRSAAFALGVLQALNRHRQLQKFDYLSTVSGGGYIGSSLTWAYTRDRVARAAAEAAAAGDPQKLAEARKIEVGKFPFGAKEQSLRETVSTERAQQRTDGTAEALDNVAFIRQQGNYLIPSRHLNGFSLAATILRNALVTASVYFALLVALLTYLTSQPGWLVARLEALGGGHVPFTFVPSLVFAAVFALLSVALGLLSWFMTKYMAESSRQYWIRWRAQWLVGWALTLAVALFAIGALPALYALAGKITLSLTTVTGAAGVVFSYLKQHRPQLAAAWPKLSGIAVTVAGLALVYTLLLAGYALALYLNGRAGVRTGTAVSALAGYAVLVGFFINTNLFGLHRMYRDRLTEAFLPSREAVKDRRWGPAYEADVAFFKDVNTDDDPGPYHLVNTLVVLTGSGYAYYRGRGGDNFIFSSLYSGAESVGWHRTEQVCGGMMTLATAMAISGAAVNPNTGSSGRGPTRNPLVSFMLAFFNIRLGYWIRNPHQRSTFGKLTQHLWPSLLYPGLRQGLFGRGQHTRSGFLELTDGGHFDNTGIYELIRRQLDVIVLSLASADPKYAYEDLADAVERVRVDFGAYISFAGLFADLAPGGVASPSGVAATLKLSKAGFEVGAITYASGKTGTLIVLKSAVLQDLPLDALRYACANDEFPNQSTADQFFDERQFEAYREAGYAVCRSMLSANGPENAVGLGGAYSAPVAPSGKWF